MDEAIRTRLFPGVAFRDVDRARRAWVIGTGLDVWEICQLANEFGSLEELVAETQLTERDVRLAFAYRGRIRLAGLSLLRTLRRTLERRGET
jgi:hypothetical protein